MKEGIARKSFADKERAKSLIKTAKERLEDYADKITLDGKNARFVVEEYYESTIEVIHAFMSSAGYICYNHDCTIEFLREYYSEVISEGEIDFLHRLRRLRNDIKYKGKELSKDEAEGWIKQTRAIFKKLLSVKYESKTK